MCAAELTFKISLWKQKQLKDESVRTGQNKECHIIAVSPLWLHSLHIVVFSKERQNVSCSTNMLAYQCITKTEPSYNFTSCNGLILRLCKTNSPWMTYLYASDRERLIQCSMIDVIYVCKLPSLSFFALVCLSLICFSTFFLCLPEINS